MSNSINDAMLQQLKDAVERGSKQPWWAKRRMPAIEADLARARS